MSAGREPGRRERIVVLDDGTRAAEGPGYLVEIDEHGEPVDIPFFMTPSARSGRSSPEAEAGSGDGGPDASSRSPRAHG